MNTAILISLAGLAATVTGLVLSRRVTRRVRVKVHKAIFARHGFQCYFVNVTNLSLNREVEITHVWFDCPEKVYALPKERPLPKRLKADETWETWVDVGALPTGLTNADVYKLGRVRLSTGKVFKSSQNRRVPSVGYVPGGDAPLPPSPTTLQFPVKQKDRLELSNMTSVLLQARSGLSATIMAVRNTESRFQNTCNDVTAELRFVQPHIKMELTFRALLVVSDGQTITGAPKSVVSLGMLETAYFAILITSRTVSSGFFTFTTWPFDHSAEKRLEYGEWHLHITVNAENGKHTTSTSFLLQLNPDLSFGWSRLAEEG